MNFKLQLRPAILLCLGSAAMMMTGCGYLKCAKQFYTPPPTPAMLGTISDRVWRMQEERAEASDFVIYEHEFMKDTPRPNTKGEDHIKNIAARLLAGQDFPVVIERTEDAVREYTEYKYPVHPDPELDAARRTTIVRMLLALNVQDADTRVVVSNAFANGENASTAAQNYQRAASNFFGGIGQGGGFGFGGFGGGGFGFGGGFGGFGF